MKTPTTLDWTLALLVLVAVNGLPIFLWWRIRKFRAALKTRLWQRYGVFTTNLAWIGLLFSVLLMLISLTKQSIEQKAIGWFGMLFLGGGFLLEAGIFYWTKYRKGER